MNEPAIDWGAAVKVAEPLGRRTLTLVARRDANAVRDRALQMASQNLTYPGTDARSATYLELATLCGYQPAAKHPGEDGATRGEDIA
jgi:hypothetical protein